MKIIDVVIARL